MLLEPCIACDYSVGVASSRLSVRSPLFMPSFPPHFDHKVALVDKLDNNEDEEECVVYEQEVVNLDDAADNALVRVHDGVRCDEDKDYVMKGSM